MFYVYENPKLDAFFGLSTDFAQDVKSLPPAEGLIYMFWNNTSHDCQVQIDTVPYMLKSQQITTATYLQKVHFSDEAPITALFFNRGFYCIRDHDHEVSCNGILFFGTNNPPIILLDAAEKRKFNLLLEVFIDEFAIQDGIQGEMLQMLLKRFIIKTTRLAKQQVWQTNPEDTKIDTIRKFNVLVDMHFRKKKQVAEYADMLFKSPKTLSNLFHQYQKTSPLQVIHARIVLEAKRQLAFTDKTIKEIAFEIGYEEDVPFHKLFKKVTGQTPQQFKKSIKG